MGLVVCPDCKKEVSQYAESCPNCGFPIQKFMKEHNLSDTTKLWVCPICAEVNLIGCSNYYLTCDRCGFNEAMIQTNISYDEYWENNYRVFKNENRYYDDLIAIEYGNGKFNQELADKRREENRSASRKQLQEKQQSTSQNQPKCPTCGSTNVEKISAGKKVKGSILFGVFSSDIRNTMHCKNCGAKW